MLLISYGTRPEYIKIKSLISNLPNIVTLFTGQHTSLIGDHHPTYSIEIKSNTSNRLNDIVCSILSHPEIFKNISAVMVQGDTTSAMAVALSAFHCEIKVIHLEAGLRTYDVNDPYPEEMNRQIISRIASIHLCPTEKNKENLLREQICEKNIYVTGNTGLDNINRNYVNKSKNNNTVIVTLHRRDNIPIMNLWFNELNKIAGMYNNLTFIFPIHPNPEIQKHRELLTQKNINIINPVDHDTMINMLNLSNFIISDSGGIQEEASFLNKHVIICRKTTERPETLGTTSILCKHPDELEKCVKEIYGKHDEICKCSFGDGNAWIKVKHVLELQHII